MNFEELKNIIKESNGEKFVILDKGKPSLVLMSFLEYKKILNNNSNFSQEANKNIEKDKNKDEDELTIDDLPLQ